MSSQLMNTPEVMEFLKVSRSTLHALRKEGLPVIKLGRCVRFRREDILEWLRLRQQDEVDDGD